jgi:hypothetical protein
MQNNQHLRYSSILALSAFILLMVALVIGNSGQYPAAQELFEYISDPKAYSAALAKAAPNLRIVLFIDAVFALTYTSAICFAAIGFSHRNPAFAWAVGLGIIAVMLLDYVENIMMVQSMDLIALKGELSIERIVSQATVSSIKWHSSAAVLFAVSFLLPGDTLIEKLFVWGTRIGLVFATSLFVTQAFDLRELGGLLILVSMASGFLLLSWVTWQRSKME